MDDSMDMGPDPVGMGNRPRGGLDTRMDTRLDFRVNTAMDTRIDSRMDRRVDNRTMDTGVGAQEPGYFFVISNSVIASIASLMAQLILEAPTINATKLVRRSPVANVARAFHSTRLLPW